MGTFWSDCNELHKSLAIGVREDMRLDCDILGVKIWENMNEIIFSKIHNGAVHELIRIHRAWDGHNVIGLIKNDRFTSTNVTRVRDVCSNSPVIKLPIPFLVDTWNFNIESIGNASRFGSVCIFYMSSRSFQMPRSLSYRIFLSVCNILLCKLDEPCNGSCKRFKVEAA